MIEVSRRKHLAIRRTMKPCWFFPEQSLKFHPEPQRVHVIGNQLRIEAKSKGRIRILQCRQNHL